MKDKKILVFDIEANGFYNDVSEVFCIATEDLNTGEQRLYRPDEIKEACRALEEADYVAGHNIVAYDIPVLKKLYNIDIDYHKCIDTLLIAKYSTIRMNKYSLKFIGEKIGSKKIEYNNFSYWEEEMGTYCIQDVRVTTKFLKEYLMRNVNIFEQGVRLEHAVRAMQTEMEIRGVSFDLQLAMRVEAIISKRMSLIKNRLEPKLGYSLIKYYQGSKKEGIPFIYRQTSKGEATIHAKRWIGDEASIKGEFCKVSFDKVTLDKANLLKYKLLELGWKPTMLTEKGAPKIAEKGITCENLSKIKGFSSLGSYFVLKHRLGLVQGLIKVTQDRGSMGYRIPSEADTLGAITGRYTHRKIVNLPAVRSQFGAPIRRMFKATDGYVFMGADLAGLEARMLAHYMEDDEFTNEVLDGDIHTFNQHKAGLPNRDAAKTFFYGLVYGAGDAKVGSLVNGGAKEGKVIKDAYFKALPKLKKLIEVKQKEASSGTIQSLDGRLIKIPREEDGRGFASRKALNSLLQSSGAIFAKTWGVFAKKYIDEHNLRAYFLISMHDEYQLEVHPDDVEETKKALYYGVEMANKLYDVKCKNDIEIKTGKNWEDTH